MTLAVLQASVLQTNGALSVAAGAQITVRTPAGAPATLYTDRAGTTPTGANPIFADSKGFFRVYAAPGRYDVTVTTSSGTQVYKDIALFADGSVIGTAATADLTTSATDTTAGRVLKVGDGGWLGVPISVSPDTVRPYSLLVSGSNPDLGGGNYAGLSVTRLAEPFRGLQIVGDTLAAGGVTLFARKAIDGLWQNTWVEIYHTGNLPDGGLIARQPAPAEVNATATLTAANLQTRIITSTTAAAVTATLPTGTLMDGLYSALTNMAFDWSVINTGGNNFTVSAGTGHTVVGGMVVVGGSSGMFRSRRTGADTWVTYRVS